jgi:hypothetical protein
MRNRRMPVSTSTTQTLPVAVSLLKPLLGATARESGDHSIDPESSSAVSRVPRPVARPRAGLLAIGLDSTRLVVFTPRQACGDTWSGVETEDRQQSAVRGCAALDDRAPVVSGFARARSLLAWPRRQWKEVRRVANGAGRSVSDGKRVGDRDVTPVSG